MVGRLRFMSLFHTVRCERTKTNDVVAIIEQIKFTAKWNYMGSLIDLKFLHFGQ